MMSVIPPWWLAEMARSNRVCRAWFHPMAMMPWSSKSSASPCWNGSDPLHEATSCTRRSLSKAGRTSSSRVTVVTLCAMRSIRRCGEMVFHWSARNPTGASTGLSFIAAVRA
ncbi:hypothetical protein DMP23_21095 [Amycolatopsis sp. A1MSW2902]